ncbi:SIR2 family protein [Myxococcus stipitatus]|uniref:SIR2 family protein n=1 Tax=Myxococcus stipitatus TaxID=83455 RepID=UPI00146C8AA3|nr:SIR2 family protein [Myxococcus stipitatus]
MGSPLSMPDTPGAPGVPGTAEMVRLARKAAGPSAEPKFDSALADAAGPQQYQLAMKFLREWRDQETVNTVIREAVLQARLSAPPSPRGDLQQLENDLPGWYLPAATRDLAKLVVSCPERFGPILTTNFDPLLSIAIRQAGGRVSQVVLHADGRLDPVRPEPDVQSLVYLHGYWRQSDTLHTPIQLTQRRPNLDASLQALLREYTLVVVGYGGWDDIIAQTLEKCGYDTQAQVDVVWTFYESDAEKIHGQNKSLFARIGSIAGRGWFRAYGGINCHTLFKAIHAAITPGIAAPATASAPVIHAEMTRSSPPPPAKERSPTASTTPEPRVHEPRPSMELAPTTPSQAKHPSRMRRFVGILLLGTAGYMGLRAFESASHRPEPTATPPPASERGRPLRERDSRGSNPTPQPVPDTQQPGGTLAPPRAVPTSGTLGVPSHPTTLEALRSQNQVKPLPRTHKAQPALEMPEGRYGFVAVEATHLLDSAEVAATPVAEAFEIHRLRGGTFILVGYVQAASRKAFEQGRAMNIVLAPRSDSERRLLVDIPFHRIVSLGLRSDDDRRVLFVSLSDEAR